MNTINTIETTAAVGDEVTYELTEERIAGFAHYLREKERAAGTIGNYLYYVTRFRTWLGGRSVTKELVVEYREYLQSLHYAVSTVNTMLSSLNTFFISAGWPQFRVGFLQVQQQIFRDMDRDLKQEEYQQLVDAAYELGMEEEALAMEALASTGMRVSELKNTTVESVEAGLTVVQNKGTVRDVLYPTLLQDKLKAYVRKNKIASGEIFLTKDGKSLTPHRIWSQMKRLAKYCGIAASKVFPHNLRHLFALKLFELTKDINKVANVLGHKNINTTRRYLMEPASEHMEQLDQLGFVKASGI